MVSQKQRGLAAAPELGVVWRVGAATKTKRGGDYGLDMASLAVGPWPLGQAGESFPVAPELGVARRVGWGCHGFETGVWGIGP